jgi:hypothetical protein
MRIIAMALLLAVASVAGATDVTVCGQNLARGEVGDLVADLDCSGVVTSAGSVVMQAGSTLRLNGHSLVGGRAGVVGYPGNRGGPLTRVEGPGTITGMVNCAILIAGKLLVSDVTLTDSDCGIDTVYGFPLMLEDVVISNNDTNGIQYISRVGSGKIKAERLTITGNGGHAILTEGRVLLRDAEITGNGAAGVVSTRKGLVARDSTITGNGPGGAYDIGAYARPHLVATTCGHSVDLRNGGSFGICASD